MKNKVLTIGEPMVVFSSNEMDKSLLDSNNFTTFASGAELNVATGLERLGIETTYLSKIGNDILGDKILKFFKSEKIDTKYISRSNKWQTGFYFKQRVSSGDPEIFYYRKKSAASHLQNSALAKIQFENYRLIHLTGILAALSPQTLALTETALNSAIEDKIISTFGPNIRLPLWKDKAQMVSTLNGLSKKAKIILPGINEGKILTGSSDPEEIASFYLQNSDITNLVVVKLGENGAYFKDKTGSDGYIKGYHATKILDTVGAGDGFAVGLISGLIDNLNIRESIKRACAIGSLAIQAYGDNDGYPNMSELSKYMKVNDN